MSSAIRWIKQKHACVGKIYQHMCKNPAQSRTSLSCSSLGKEREEEKLTLLTATFKMHPEQGTEVFSAASHKRFMAELLSKIGEIGKSIDESENLSYQSKS